MTELFISLLGIWISRHLRVYDGWPVISVSNISNRRNRTVIRCFPQSDKTCQICWNWSVQASHYRTKAEIGTAVWGKIQQHWLQQSICKSYSTYHSHMHIMWTLASKPIPYKYFTYFRRYTKYYQGTPLRTSRCKRFQLFSTICNAPLSSVVQLCDRKYVGTKTEIQTRNERLRSVIHELQDKIGRLH